MRLKNRTSGVPVDRTVARIEYALVSAGASNIVKDYDEGILKGICFTVREHGRIIAVKLPAKVEAVKEIIREGMKRPRAGTLKKIEEQASRTAWKLVQDWIEVQVSMIAYCGEGFPVDDEAATQVSEHIRTCEKHPMRRVEKERDEAMKLAYIGEHRFPQNSWKVRCEEEVEGRRAAEKEVEKLAKEDVAFLSGRAELCGRFCFGMVPPRLAGWPQRDFGACANALVRLAYGGDPPREDEYAYDQEDALAAFRAMLHMPAHRCTHAVLDAFRKATENVRQDGEEPCRR